MAGFAFLVVNLYASFMCNSKLMLGSFTFLLFKFIVLIFSILKIFVL